MKKYIVFPVMAFAVFITLTFNSCTKLASVLSQTLTFTTPAQSFTIPRISDTVAVGTNLFMPTVSGAFSYNLDSFIKANTNGVLGVNNISGVTIKNCQLTCTNADSLSNFQDFQSVSISFASASNTTPYKLSVNQPDVYSNTMTLTPADSTAEFKSYLQGSSFNYSMDGQMRRGTADSMKCNVTFTFTIKVHG